MAEGRVEEMGRLVYEPAHNEIPASEVSYPKGLSLTLTPPCDSLALTLTLTLPLC